MNLPTTSQTLYVLSRDIRQWLFQCGHKNHALGYERHSIKPCLIVGRAGLFIGCEYVEDYDYIDNRTNEPKHHKTTRFYFVGSKPKNLRYATISLPDGTHENFYNCAFIYNVPDSVAEYHPFGPNFMLDTMPQWLENENSAKNAHYYNFNLYYI